MGIFIVGIVVVLIALGASGLLQLYWQASTDRRRHLRQLADPTFVDPVLANEVFADPVFVDEVFIDGEGPYPLIRFGSFDDCENAANVSEVRPVTARAPRRAS